MMTKAELIRECGQCLGCIYLHDPIPGGVVMRHSVGLCSLTDQEVRAGDPACLCRMTEEDRDLWKRGRTKGRA